MKFLKILALIILTIIIIASVGGYFFLKNLDLNKYTPTITSMVEKKTGRKLSIKNIAIKPSLVPTVIVEDISFSNPLWAKTPHLATVKKIELQVAIKPLLNKEFHIKKFIVDSPYIDLFTNEEGVGNWVFRTPNKSAVPLNTSFKFELISSAHAQEPAKLEIPNINIEKVLITNGQFFYNQQKASINSFEFAMPGKDQTITSNFDVSYLEHNIKGSTSSGSLNILLDNKTPYPAKINAIYNNATINFDGTLLTPLCSDIGYAGNLIINNPQNNLNLPKISLNTDIEGCTKRINATINNLDIASNIITGRINANIEEKPFIDAFITSDKIDIQTLKAKETQAIKLPSLISTANATTLIAPTPINYSALNLLDAKITLDIKNLIINSDLDFNNTKATANLKDGVLLLKPFDTNIKDGNIFATASIDASTQTINANIKTKNLKLQDLHKEFLITDDNDFGITSGGNIEFDANIITSGNTTKALLENLNGRVIAIANKSVIQTGNTTLLNGFAGTILNTIKLSNTKQNKELDLTCAVIRTDIKNGILNFPQSIAMQSNDLSLVANGYVSLGDDSINLDLHPYSKDIAKANLATSLGGFVKIGGTIQKPKIKLDEEQAIKTIVGVLATGGASYVGSQVVLDQGSSPCYTALEETGYQNQFPKPTKTQQVYQETNKKIDDSINELKSSAKTLLNNFLQKN